MPSSQLKYHMILSFRGQIEVQVKPKVKCGVGTPCVRHAWAHHQYAEWVFSRT